MRDRTSALFGELNPDAATWTSEAYLLAEVCDILAAANWQRAGDSKAKRPQPHPRPGDARRESERSASQFAQWRESRQPRGVDD